MAIQKAPAVPPDSRASEGLSSRVSHGACKTPPGGALGGWVKVALCAVGFLVCLPAPGQGDWTQWRGPGRDGSVPGRTKSVNWPSNLTKVWEREVGGGYSGPLVAGNRIWVHAREGDREVVSCLTLDQGEPLWRNLYEAKFQQEPSARVAGKGPYSTPSLADGRLFTLGITTILSAWDAETGELLWRRDYSPEFEPGFSYFGTAVSPLVWQGFCFVHFGGHDREKPDLPGHGAMTALNVLDGREEWRWAGDAPAVGASPIISVIGGQPQLVFKSERKIAGLDPHTGKELWQIPFKVRMDNTIVTPLVLGDQLITSDHQMGMRAWRIHSDGESWTARERWRNRQVSLAMSSPVLSGGQLVGFSETRSGELFGLDPTDGRLLWRGEPRWGDHATLIAWGDEVLVFREDGSLVVGEVSRDQFRIVKRYRLGNASPVWGHAAIFDNRIIARDGSRLAVFQVGGKTR